jgi:hypothetical protein
LLVAAPLAGAQTFVDNTEPLDPPVATAIALGPGSGPFTKTAVGDFTGDGLSSVLLQRGSELDFVLAPLRP